MYDASRIIRPTDQPTDRSIVRLFFFFVRGEANRLSREAKKNHNRDARRAPSTQPFITLVQIPSSSRVTVHVISRHSSARLRRGVSRRVSRVSSFIPPHVAALHSSRASSTAPRCARTTRAIVTPIELYAFAVVALGLILYGYPVGVTNVMLGARPNFSAMPSSRATWNAGDVSQREFRRCAPRVRARARAGARLQRRRISAAALAFHAEPGSVFFASIGMCVTPVRSLMDALGRRGPAMWFGFWRLVYGVGQTLSYSGGGVHAELASQRSAGIYR